MLRIPSSGVLMAAAAAWIRPGCVLPAVLSALCVLLRRIIDRVRRFVAVYADSSQGTSCSADSDNWERCIQE